MGPQLPVGGHERILRNSEKSIGKKATTCLTHTASWAERPWPCDPRVKILIAALSHVPYISI